MSIEIKIKIENCLRDFSQGSLSQNSLNLFASLGYNIDRQASLDKPAYSAFKAAYAETNNRFNEEKARVKEWQYVDLLFQLSKDEVTQQHSLFDTRRVDKTIIETYLFFVIELTGSLYNRTAFSQITREVNKLFPMPAMILFKTGNNLTLSVINRRLHKRDESKDVLEKVTLIKDISIENPHRAHVEILFDLSFDELLTRFKFTNFVELHNAWKKTLDTKELNKRFYQELFNWYLWACRSVEFNKPEGDDTDGAVHASISVIRMLTRLIFCWFIKEKRLIPDKLFDEKELAGTLRKFAPSSMENSDYYTAILQNLFFATFNTEMPKDSRGSRKFHEKHEWNASYSEGYMDHLLYRYRECFSDPDKALTIFAGIPFLNGGLFECLDTRDQKTGKEMRYDGFSSKPSKRPKVPNGLFFGTAIEIDLSGDFGEDKKKKHETVRGLINIFNDFKFTIEENTPLEEEIALDPELLGKVFENLLASYNPETKTTARKQTGSFYTPREIVNYMVDESLIAYLKSKLTFAPQSHEELAAGQFSALGNDQLPGQTRLIMSHDNRDEKREKEIEEKLRQLFDPAIEGNLLTHDDKDVDRIIEHLSNCRILDPACGSGAFPMGVLHKMVYVLARLDPNNKKWKQAQLKKAERDCDAAKKMEDPEIREKAVESAKLRIGYIRESFDNPNHELDYARKLFLIENCVYGVDIQNIAVQISKLRFFISLMVDQRVDEKKPNMGILSLPNLETKFVAANTLIGLDKEKNLLELPEVKKLEQQLHEIRQRVFFTRKYSEKKKLKKQESDTREELKNAIKKGGFGLDTAKKVADWNPFDPVHSAPFFDVETMFNFTGGFDVVIGNPPYGAKFSKDFRIWARQFYETAIGELDSYLLFVERNANLLSEMGHLSFILPDTWLTLINAEQFRRWIISRYEISELALLNGLVFDAGVVDTMLMFLMRRKPLPATQTRIIVAKKDLRVVNVSELPILSLTSQLLWLNNPQAQIRAFATPENDLLLDKINSESVLLDKIVDYRSGCKPYEEGKGTPPQTKKTLESKPFTSEIKRAKKWLPLLRGNDVQRYCLISKKPEWISYGDWLAAPRTMEVFSGNRILIQAIRNPSIIDRIIATITDDTFITRINVYSLLKKHGAHVDLYALLTIINSRLMNWLLKRTYGLHTYVITGVLALPIKKEAVDGIAAKKLRKLCEEMLLKKKDGANTPTLNLDARIDALIAQLYKLTLDEYTLVLTDLKVPENMKSTCLEEFRKIAANGLAG
jgi:adenine-specific DNA-methyltransferase